MNRSVAILLLLALVGAYPSAQNRPALALSERLSDQVGRTRVEGWLEPYRANAVDISFEKYFGEASYVALALFYKELDSYVYQREIRNWDFTGYPNDSGYTPISNFGSSQSIPCNPLLPTMVSVPLR